MWSVVVSSALQWIINTIMWTNERYSSEYILLLQLKEEQSESSNINENDIDSQLTSKDMHRS